MRIVSAIWPLVFTVILIYILDVSLAGFPAIGKLLDPVDGVWANAEPTTNDFNQEYQFPEISKDVSVWFDDRMVPHIHAEEEYDLYFMQGYIHATFRLWQMDLQTRAAGGRVSEILGSKALNFDRMQRRKGMVYGAEQSLSEMMKDKRTAVMLDAYTAGINKYISSLGKRDYPLEYKLMGFAPEKWTNIRSALLLKYMADDLTGENDDIELSYLRSALGKERFDYLFPNNIQETTPVIPTTTSWEQPSLNRPAVPDSNIWATVDKVDFDAKPKEDGKGSNNWVISGSRTKSGNPILCNDPHLSLSLPSLWFEVQLQCKGMNAYGVSLPGAPGIVIGFNDSISWGFTNNYRDVKDYYAIDVISNDSYRFDGKDMPFEKRVEVIHIKGQEDYNDTVKYTVHGPVMYDRNFNAIGGYNKPIAVKWMAHTPTNELLSVYLLDHSNSYDDFVKAISYFECPAQNLIYADRKGNIALWGQGRFINKWVGQGRYVMKGDNSNTLWGDAIPMNENPHALNPAQGYLASANQTVTDTTYPYWYNGNFVEFRAWRINQLLSDTNKRNITVEDMQKMQQDVHSYLAEKSLPVLLNSVSENSLAADQKEIYKSLSTWNYNLDAESTTATAFQIWWHYFYYNVWQKELGKMPIDYCPMHERTMQLLVEDSSFVARANDIISTSFKQACDSFGRIQSKEWYKVKNTTVQHLTKIPAFSFPTLKTGGWGNTINAMKGNHGPSWRMVVEMGAEEINAYGVYPGGQSGNVASKYYATFIKSWEQGDYYKLLFLPNDIKQENKQIQYIWTIKNGSR